MQGLTDRPAWGRGERVYKRLKTYRERIDALLADPPADLDWADAIAEHLVQISFFQHERLVHLLVTLAFAIMELGSAVAAVLAPSATTGALMLLLLALLVPYIVHYYHLENETQKLYAQHDQMRYHMTDVP